MDLIRVIIISIFIFISANSARAAEFTIMPWPDQDGDYIKAINIVKSNAPSKMMLSLWGWGKLEGERDSAALAEEVKGAEYAVSHGLNKGKYYGITVIDTIKRVVPLDLQDVAWDDPALLARYVSIVRRLRNELAASPDYFIISNETDVYFENHPEEKDAFLKFASSAQKAVKEIFPTTQVGFTVTFEGLVKNGTRAAFAKQLMNISDMAFLTYYPVIDMKLVALEDTPAQLDIMMEIAGTKSIALQEIGYPSAITGSSEEQQARFFEMIIPQIQKRPRFKFVNIFNLHDFNAETCGVLTEYYGFDGLPESSQSKKDFQNFICSLGLLRADGSPKPAWQSTMNAFKNIN